MAAIELRTEGRVAILTVERADALNALSSALLHELRDALMALSSDASVGAVVLTGAGEKAFIAGADIAELAAKSPLEARTYAELGQLIGHLLETMPRPTIAAVNGYALGGGCEIALACDIRLASTRARFGQPEITLGLIPGWGGTQRLARATSLGFAKELILTGRMVDADEALARGIVNAVHPPEELLAKAIELAGTIAARSPIAAGYAKQAANRALSGDLAASLVHEADLFSILFSTNDAREGMAAFLEKREARFSGS
jgi:enoyl-CoA hydratase